MFSVLLLFSHLQQFLHLCPQYNLVFHLPFSLIFPSLGTSISCDTGDPSGLPVYSISICLLCPPPTLHSSRATQLPGARPAMSASPRERNPSILLFWAERDTIFFDFPLYIIIEYDRKQNAFILQNRGLKEQYKYFILEK